MDSLSQTESQSVYRNVRRWAVTKSGFLNASFTNFVGAVPASFQTLGYGEIGPIPVSILMLLGVALIGGFILQRTRYGAHLYGVGGSEKKSPVCLVSAPIGANYGPHHLCDYSSDFRLVHRRSLALARCAVGRP